MDFSSADEFVDAGVEERSLSNEEDDEVFAADIRTADPIDAWWGEGSFWDWIAAPEEEEEALAGPPELLSEFSEPNDAVMERRFLRLVSS